jgi:hypothetical protein
VTAMLYEHHFRAMNTGIGVWVWSTDLEGVSIIRAEMRRAEDLFTGVEAELSRFRAMGRGPQAISRMLWTVLVAALDAAYESGGIYDPTVLQSLERAGYDRSFDAIEASGDTGETDAPPVTTFGSLATNRDGRRRSFSRAPKRSHLGPGRHRERLDARSRRARARTARSSARGRRPCGRTPCI